MRDHTPAETDDTSDAVNPHSDLPLAGDISTEIPTVPSPQKSGEKVADRPDEGPLPFGVYFGTHFTPPAAVVPKS